MSKELIVPMDDKYFGPAMRKLNEQEQRFVVALYWTGGKQRRAYEAAGYACTNQNTIDAGASRIAARPNVQAAIKEYAQGQLNGLVPMAIGALQEILGDVTHKDRAKVSGMILDRTGLHALSEHKVTVEQSEDRADKLRKVVELAKSMGVDPKTLLGNVSDVVEADFRVVEESAADDGRAGLEDLLG